MASRKITRNAKKPTPVAKAKPVAKSPAKVAVKKTPAAAGVRGDGAVVAKPPSPPNPKPQVPRKSTDALPSTAPAEYLPSGLESLLRRLRLHDQAEAKKLEPGISHLAKAYGKLLGKA